MIMADVAQKAIEQMVNYKAKAIAQELATGKYTHDFPLGVDKLRELGLNVSTTEKKL